MSTPKISDCEVELLQCLRQFPENTMAELAERYTNLVRSVVERFLDNPEDIDECVNDTFLEFFRVKDQFDQKKGNLRTYLTGIAKNLAISRFRKITAHPTSELLENTIDRSDPIGDAERRADLEQAIDQLPPEEAELIYLKYYEGMTLQEVAGAQRLPYETVKKRHQRSLNKLRVLLTSGLILLLAALLAACAYMALRHFRLLPGYGMSRDTGGPVYLLTEESSAKGEHWTYTVKEAVLLENSLRINISVHFEDAENAWRQWRELRDQYGGAQAELAQISGKAPQMIDVFDPYGYDADIDLLFHDAASLLEGKEAELTPRIYEAELSLVLTRVDLEHPEDYSYALADEGGVLAIPNRQDGVLAMELYPLNSGKYEISSNLIYGAYRQGKAEDITVTDEDGQIHTGNVVMVHSLFPDRLSVWEFGPAEPGKYVLHIPYLYLLYQILPQNMQSIAINLENCHWEDQAMELPFGTIRLTACERVELGEYPDVPAWRIVMEFDTELELNTPPLSLRIMGANAICTYNALPDHRYEIVARLPTDEEKSPQPELETFDPTQAQITLVGTVSLLWDQELTIPITVE